MAKTSAMYETPSPIAEIVVDEKTSRKSRSASAPARSLRPARLGRPHGEAVHDLFEHLGVGVQRLELQTAAFCRLFREAPRAVLADRRDVAVAVEQVVDDLEEQSHVRGECSP